jgi:hypothetical protein
VQRHEDGTVQREDVAEEEESAQTYVQASVQREEEEEELAS